MQLEPFHSLAETMEHAEALDTKCKHPCDQDHSLDGQVLIQIPECITGVLTQQEVGTLGQGNFLIWNSCLATVDRIVTNP